MEHEGMEITLKQAKIENKFKILFEDSFFKHFFHSILTLREKEKLRQWKKGAGKKFA